ncbi:unnamed protein product [Malus baccata var. baccata]
MVTELLDNGFVVLNDDFILLNERWFVALFILVKIRWFVVNCCFIALFILLKKWLLCFGCLHINIQNYSLLNYIMVGR